MDEKRELIAVCPYVRCNRVIFRKTTLDIRTERPDIITFNTRCPHCGENVKIRIEAIIKTEPIS